MGDSTVCPGSITELRVDGSSSGPLENLYNVLTHLGDDQDRQCAELWSSSPQTAENLRCSLAKVLTAMDCHRPTSQEEEAPEKDTLSEWKSAVHWVARSMASPTLKCTDDDETIRVRVIASVTAIVVGFSNMSGSLVTWFLPIASDYDWSMNRLAIMPILAAMCCSFFCYLTLLFTNVNPRDVFGAYLCGLGAAIFSHSWQINLIWMYNMWYMVLVLMGTLVNALTCTHELRVVLRYFCHMLIGVHDLFD